MAQTLMSRPVSGRLCIATQPFCCHFGNRSDGMPLYLVEAGCLSDDAFGFLNFSPVDLVLEDLSSPEVPEAFPLAGFGFRESVT